MRNYKVTFTGDYFVLYTVVDVPVPLDDNEDIESRVVAFACDRIEMNYGWDVLDVATSGYTVEEV